MAVMLQAGLLLLTGIFGAEAQTPAERGAVHGESSAERRDDNIWRDDNIAPPSMTTKCSGFDEEWGECPGLKPCTGCEPRNCKFGNWQEWYEAGGCIGLKWRNRQVLVENNECGAPCNGAKMMAARSIRPECQIFQQDCEFSQWSQWSSCELNERNVYRSRREAKEAVNGGVPCSGPLKMSRECAMSQEASTDCRLSPWHVWTECSTTCGTGQHTRVRRVEQHAQHGGQPCTDPIQEVAQCALNKCPSGDCVLGEWGLWSTCGAGTSQMYRDRKISRQAIGDGLACEALLKETTPCVVPDRLDCVISDWGVWNECDNQCGGGQRYRHRAITQEPKNDGLPCTAELLYMTEPCNIEPCLMATSDCMLSQWTGWTNCSSKCGDGEQRRTRAVDVSAKMGGRGCSGAVEEIVSCTGNQGCDNVDCLWGDWFTWSACTCTCGGGTKKRARVVSQAPRKNGKLCDPEHKSEMAVCSSQPCPNLCIDAEWSPWTAWSACSASCGNGVQSRTRDIEEEASPCGKPLEGRREEYRTCEDAGEQLQSCTPDADCMLGIWGDWSSCSCSCFGTRDRNRVITQYAAGNGKACSVDNGMGTLREVQPCNPGSAEATNPGCGRPPAKDCILSEWTDNVCSRTCGGGQTMRSRHIAQLPAHGGIPCDPADPLVETSGCNTQSCRAEVCIDCMLAPWSDWSSCSHCGDQRYRFRHVSQIPNHCGQPCPEGVEIKETGYCHSPCQKELFCGWSEWSEGSGCMSGRGGNLMKTRSLGLSEKTMGSVLFSVVSEDPQSSLCTGMELSVKTCPNEMGPLCVAKDCTFSQWGEWSGSTCIGLCSRGRFIADMQNKCGIPCQGPLVETKYCEPDCAKKPVDCVLKTWSPWTECTAPNGQRSRERAISVYPMNDGVACRGALRETAQCGGVAKVACELSAWSEWTTCSKKCGGGTQTRMRVVAKRARHGGEPCHGSLEELSPCGEPCPGPARINCEYNQWSLWSSCDADRQQTRDREIRIQASNSGTPCGGVGGVVSAGGAGGSDGGLKETKTCGIVIEDCLVSPWTKWDQCDKQCGGGQHTRHRQINRFATNGGKECPSALVQAEGCNQMPCNKQDCVVGEWASWSECSTHCGVGQQTRNRRIVSESSENGIGCKDYLDETRSCPNNPQCAVQDCVWDVWTEWSGCSCTCGGGQKSRLRHIKVAPGPGGKPCDPKEKEVVVPCATQACSTTPHVDGEWSEWSSWSPCSATCKSGVTFRTRKVAFEAEGEGTPAWGPDRESNFCNVDVTCEASVDCEFSAWGTWSDCSQKCDGVKRRTRRIAQFGRGDGAYCIGALKETWPCNPGPGEQKPLACGNAPSTDQELSVWSEWSPCTSTCNGGQHTRTRAVLQEASGGGNAYAAPLEAVEECGRQACPGPDAINCAYGEWQDWAACGKCGGQRKRFRHIVTYPRYGGSNCEPYAAEETGGCQSHCEKHFFCTWQTWMSWGACSAQCGHGRRMRQRRLAASTVHAPTPDTTQEVEAEMPDVIQRFELARQRSTALEARNNMGLVTAFVAGFGMLAAMIGGFRVFMVFRTSSRASPSGGQQHALLSQTEMALVEQSEDGGL